MHRILLVPFAILTPLVYTQFFPIRFTEQEHALERFGWPFWYDRQYWTDIQGTPYPFWYSSWLGINVWAILGNVAFAVLAYLSLLMIGVITGGFRAFRMIDLFGLTIAVAISLAVRASLSDLCIWCESAVGSTPRTPDSLTQVLLRQFYYATIFCGIFAILQARLTKPNIDNQAVNRSRR